MKSNFLYVLYATFNSDLLFWIVIDNLFLSTVKGMSEFNIILITMIGILASILLYPLTNFIMRKCSNRISNIISSCCCILAIVLFCCCQTIYGFIVAQTFYSLGAPFRQTSALMLRNNLIAQGKEEDFVKWKSYGMLGYSIVTAVLAGVSGFLFNVYAYLPVFLSIGGAVISLIISIIYKEPEPAEKEKIEEQKVSLKPLFKSKLMWIIFTMNIIMVGALLFLHTRTTLVLQAITGDAGFDLSTISIIISVVILSSSCKNNCKFCSATNL